MKILYICNDLDYFLAHRGVLAREMAEEGHDVRLISGGIGRIDEHREPFEVHTVTVDQRRLNPVADMKLAREIWRQLSAFHPDAVHAITMKPNLMAAIVLATRRWSGRSGPALVMTFAGLGRLFAADAGWAIRASRRLATFLFTLAGRVVRPFVTCESEADRAMLIEAGIAKPDRAIVTPGSGVDFTAFTPAEHSGPLTVLFAGRLLKAKGADWFLEAARRLASEDVRFVLAGPLASDDGDSLTAGQVDAAVERGSIDYLGAVGSEEMPELLRATDIMCLPTRYREGLPRIVTEAAACGCAILVTPGGNKGHIVVDGETGRVLDTLSCDAFVSDLEEMIADPETVRQMGRTAAKRVRSLGLSDRDVIDRFRKLYRDALASRPS